MTSYENYKVSDRITYTYLIRRTGGKLGRVPALLANKIIHRSRRGELGQIVVRRFSGVQENKAALAIGKFVRNVGADHQELGTTMLASKTLPKGMRRVAEALLDPKNKRKSAAFIVAEYGGDAADVIEHYAKGAVQSRRYEVIAMAAREMPRVVRELIRYTIPRKTLCKTCLGLKQIKVQGKWGHREPEVCLTCHGTGWEGDLKSSEFAIEKLAEISTLIEDHRAPLVQVQQNNVQIQGTKLMERILGMSDQDDVIEAEKVEPSVDNPS